jgi:ligand-binding sensor domain-containing protein/signal transduction histidine kinase
LAVRTDKKFAKPKGMFILNVFMGIRIRTVVELLFVGLSLVFSLSVRAEQTVLDRYDYHPYTEGLPQNSVKSIVQTRDGYLWFGTRFGLARFDGDDFTIYDSASNPSLKDDNCSSLVEDRVDGTLWICQPRMVTGFRDRRFTRFGIAKDENSETMRQFTAASDGGLWIGAEHGLLRFKDGKVVRRFTMQDGLKTNAVWSVFLDDAGALWTGTSLGLQKFDTRAATFQDVTAPDGLLQSWTTCVYSAGGELWVGNHKGVHLLREGRWTTFPGLADKANSVEGFLRDSGGKTWIVTRNGPLQCAFEGHLVPLPLDLSFVTEPLSVFEDRERNLWFGTSFDGVARLRPHQISTHSTHDGLIHNDTWSICEGRDGRIWIGSQDGISEMKDSRIIPHPISAPGERCRVRSVYEDRNGMLWVGTVNLGLQTFNKGVWRAVPLTGLLTRQEVGAIAEDSRGTLWVGTKGDLHFREGDKFTPFRSASGEPIADVRAILEDRGGHLWFGTYRDGLYRWKDGKLDHFTRSNGLPSDCAWSLCEDQTGTLWIGTDNGLVRFKAEAFFVFTKKQGLMDNIVNSILEDDAGVFWISCNRGIYRVARGELDLVAMRRMEQASFIAYGASDGMLNRETNGGSQPSACKSRDGQFWFPTIKGVASFNPSTIRHNALPPPLQIEKILSNGTAVERGGQISLPPGGGSLVEIQYTANSFSAPEKVRFQHRLSPGDTGWSAPTALRAAHYRNLKPGSYTFQIKACNNHGIWNETPAELAFVIAPHFYETPFFYILCASALLAAAFAVHWARVRVLTKIQSLEHGRALEGERTRIAREMHDELGATLTQISLLGELAHRELHHPPSAELHLLQIKKTARNLFRSLDEIVWAVNPKNDFLPSLMDYIFHYAQEYLRPAGIRLRLDQPESVPRHPLSSEERHNLFMAVKESLSNIVKHAAAREVWVRLQLKEGQAEILIEDDGCGFNADSSHSGRNGLANMRQRLHNMGGRFEIGKRLPTGTAARFSLPLRPPE